MALRLQRTGCGPKSVEERSDSATVTQWPRRAPGERPVIVHDGGALSTAPAAWS
jgi:hypothetical protein